MVDLLDGQTVEVQGSASRPYALKNIGGVYSCSCPAWRNQSLSIDRRTCKHLRQLRGDETEAARIGNSVTNPVKPVNNTARVPPLLLAESWDDSIDPTGWHLSEKLDGVRAWWDGKQFVSRQGNRYWAPDWFTADLPLEPLDGELWIGRKKFQRTVSIVRRHDQPDLWKEVRFVVFDAPGHDGDFECRLDLVKFIMEYSQPQYAMAHQHVRCEGHTYLRDELARIEALGGEGLMLRQARSPYAFGRSSTLLKVKSFHDAEARVIGHEPGAGRHKGRLGALLVEMPNGIRFAVGTGFTDVERGQPPPIGSTITYRYQELTDGGVPRFPSFVRQCDDAPILNLFPKGEASMSNLATPQSAVSSSATERRFEYVEGSSDKFWAISVHVADVTVRFGRNGTNGQSSTKTFIDSAAAQKHADKLIGQKTVKGYREVNRAA